MENKIKINTQKIPGIEMRLFCSNILKAIERCYDDPEFQAKFEKFKEGKANACSNQ